MVEWREALSRLMENHAKRVGAELKKTAAEGLIYALKRVIKALKSEKTRKNLLFIEKSGKMFGDIKKTPYLCTRNSELRVTPYDDKQYGWLRSSTE